MGWLDCEPDDLYLDYDFTVADVQHVLPSTARQGALWMADEVSRRFPAYAALVSRLRVRAMPMQFHALVRGFLVFKRAVG
jgi:hypothetical protein